MPEPQLPTWRHASWWRSQCVGVKTLSMVVARHFGKRSLRARERPPRYVKRMLHLSGLGRRAATTSSMVGIEVAPASICLLGRVPHDQRRLALAANLVAAPRIPPVARAPP